jgi:23S rRNA (cytidine1920-2'-O)/16S rRNA (cytidine1409-2'-O)-methyltransferase
MVRADVLLVEMGLVASRAKAQELIEGGRVYVLTGDRRTQIKKVSQKIDVNSGAQIEVAADANELRFVSRGGLKLRGALDRLQIDPSGWRVLDVGISTGGFSDCLLKAGATHVVGVDVGHGQLASTLQVDPRVVLFEGINARNLSEPDLWRLLLSANGEQKFDLVVIDVSFISLTLVLPQVIQYLDKDGLLLALVKPQFEVGRDGLGKNGIVKDPELYREVQEKILATSHVLGLKVEDYFESSIQGSDGNREFFLSVRSV